MTSSRTSDPGYLPPSRTVGCPHQYVTEHGSLVVDPKAKDDERCNHHRVTISFTFEIKEAEGGR